MKKAELYLLFTVFIGIILKIFEVPGNTILIILSLSSLSIIYFYFGILLFNDIRLKDIFKKISYKKTTAKSIIGSIGLGIALSTIVIGILFKIEIWPGSNNLLKPGLYLLSTILVVTFAINRGRESNFYKRIYSRGIIIGILGLVMYLIPFDVLIDLYYNDKPEVAEIMKEVMKDPQNQELQDELDVAFEKYLNEI